MWVEVTEEDDAIFRTVWVAICVFLIFEIAMEGRALPIMGRRS